MTDENDTAKGNVLSLHFAHCFKLCCSMELRSLMWDLKCCTLRTNFVTELVEPQSLSQTFRV